MHGDKFKSSEKCNRQTAVGRQRANEYPKPTQKKTIMNIELKYKETK